MYHLVFVSKCRYRVFRNEHTKSVCTDAFHEVEKNYGIKIEALEFQLDHMHLMVHIPARLSVSYTVQLLKVSQQEVYFDMERKRKGIEFMHIFDYEVKAQKPEILEVVGKPYKFLPKEYSSPAAVDIFGDRVITFVGVKPGRLDEEPIQFVMGSKRLADGYKKFFQFMWDRL